MLAKALVVTWASNLWAWEAFYDYEHSCVFFERHSCHSCVFCEFADENSDEKHNPGYLAFVGEKLKTTLALIRANLIFHQNNIKTI